MRAPVLAALAVLIVSTVTSAAAEEWAVLGYELGCWNAGSVRRTLATDRNHPELANLGRFTTPDEFADQLRKRGMSPKTDKADFMGYPVVTVTANGGVDVRFISRRYCGSAPYNER